MERVNQNTLLAATRVTGSVPHIGTFYGWILPIIKASENMNVVVVIADYQSLDVKHNEAYSILAKQLRCNLQKYLSPTIPIVLESEVPSLALLGHLIAGLFNNKHLSRIPAFIYSGLNDINLAFNSLAYPAYMIADIMAFNATHIFARTEGNYQPVDIMNDILKRGRAKYGWPDMKLLNYYKDNVAIPRIDGDGVMRRDGGSRGVIEILGMSLKKINKMFDMIIVPEVNCKKSEREGKCLVVSKIWDAVFPNEKKYCFNSAYPCYACKKKIAIRIFQDISKNMIVADNYNFKMHNIVKLANSRCKEFIKLAINGL